MANLTFDFSNNAVFKRDKDTKTYIYRDIGTDNFRLTRTYTDESGAFDSIERKHLCTLNTSHINGDCIKNALNNIFSFNRGEMILEPMFGNTLYRYLYEPMNKYTADKISRTIRQMVEDWEPRIKIIDIPIVGDDKNMTYYIKLQYLIPELDTYDEFEIKLTQ